MIILKTRGTYLRGLESTTMFMASFVAVQDDKNKNLWKVLKSRYTKIPERMITKETLKKHIDKHINCL